MSVTPPPAKRDTLYQVAYLMAAVWRPEALPSLVTCCATAMQTVEAWALGSPLVGAVRLLL